MVVANYIIHSISINSVNKNNSDHRPLLPYYGFISCDYFLVLYHKMDNNKNKGILGSHLVCLYSHLNVQLFSYTHPKLGERLWKQHSVGKKYVIKHTLLNFYFIILLQCPILIRNKEKQRKSLSSKKHKEWVDENLIGSNNYEVLTLTKWKREKYMIIIDRDIIWCNIHFMES